MKHAVIAAVVLGALSTVGDLLWAGLSLRHRVLYGLAHGAVICLGVGAFVGWRARQPIIGAAVGLVVGVLAAGVFYAIAGVLGYYAMFPAWMFFWICFALLQKGLTREQGWRDALIRGLAAATLSALAFYAISGIWTNPPRQGPRYLYNFGAWSFAFLPGFLALFTELRHGRRVDGKTAERRML